MEGKIALPLCPTEGGKKGGRGRRRKESERNHKTVFRGGYWISISKEKKKPNPNCRRPAPGLQHSVLGEEGGGEKKRRGRGEKGGKKRDPTHAVYPPVTSSIHGGKKPYYQHWNFCIEEGEKGERKKGSKLTHTCRCR